MPTPLPPHRWDVSPADAIRIQKALRPCTQTQGKIHQPQLVAGADIALDKGNNIGYAGAIVFTFPHLEEIERQWIAGPITFPYIPGLLTFREGPLLIQLFQKLQHTPDLIFFDGQGLAHPRRMGIATHMGLLLGIPSIGCGKSRLIGTHKQPGPRKGNRAALKHAGETLGVALRTKDNVKPIYLSIGHALELQQATRLTLRCCDGYRIPRPTRLADHFVGQIRKKKRNFHT